MDVNLASTEPPVDLPEDTSDDALNEAIRHDAWEEARRLLNCRNNQRVLVCGSPLGWTTLHMACGRLAPKDVVESILQTSADCCLNQDDRGCTPLMIACLGSSDDNILLVLDACPQAATLRDKWGRTPLHVVLFHARSPRVIQALLSVEPKMVRVADRDGDTPLSDFFLVWHGLACRFCEGVLTLSEQEELSWLSEGSDFLLRAWTRGGDVDWNDDETSWNVLHASIMTELCPWVFVRFFAKLHPEQARIPDASGNLPLHLVCASEEGCDPEAFDDLAKAYPGAVAVKNSSGQTPLHIAATCSAVGDDTSCIPPLLKMDTGQAREKDNDGNLPLHLLCASHLQSGDIIFDQLFKAYPDAIHEKNQMGLAPLDIALDPQPAKRKASVCERQKSTFCDDVEDRDRNRAQENRLAQMNLIFRLLIRDPALIPVLPCSEGGRPRKRQKTAK